MKQQKLTQEPESKGRRNFSSQEKVRILKKHLVEKVAVSELCQQHNLHPTVFYRWLKEFFENGAAAFDKPAGQTKPSEGEGGRVGGEAEAEERGVVGTDGRARLVKKVLGRTDPGLGAARPAG